MKNDVPFDYTQWRESQFHGKSVETIFAEAGALRAETEALEEKRMARSCKSGSGEKSAKPVQAKTGI